MKGILRPLTGIGVEVGDVPYPTLRPGWTIIKVKACGICGSDVAGAFPIAPPSEAMLTKMASMPRLASGHEYVGEVAEVGEGVSDLVVGDHVAVNPWYWNACGKCESCRSYRPYDCRSPIQVPRGGGGMAEYASAPAAFTHKLSKDLPWDDAVLIEPLTITFAAAYDFSNFKVGKTAAILGPGPIGLLTLAMLQLSTPSLTVVTGTKSDVSPRLEIAKKLGADVTINAEEEDPVKKVMELTGNHGVEFVYEAAGVPLISQGLKMLAKEGEYTAIGHAHGRPIKMEASDYQMLQGRWAKINGMILEKASVWYTVINLLTKRKMNVNPVITHHVSLDGVPEAFDIMHQQKGCKIVINP